MKKIIKILQRCPFEGPSAKKGGMAVQGSNSFSVLFSYIISTTYQKIGDLLCHVIFLDIKLHVQEIFSSLHFDEIFIQQFYHTKKKKIAKNIVKLFWGFLYGITCTCLRCRCSSIGSSSVMNMVVNVVSVCCSSQGKMARIRICRKIITVGRSEFCHTKIIEILPENIKITKIYHTEHILRRCHWEKVCQCTKYIVAQIHKK